MGRPKRKSGRSSGSRKRPKVSRRLKRWIETVQEDRCDDDCGGHGHPVDLTIWITRAVLKDDFHPVLKEKESVNTPEELPSSSLSTAQECSINADTTVGKQTRAATGSAGPIATEVVSPGNHQQDVPTDDAPERTNERTPLDKQDNSTPAFAPRIIVRKSHAAQQPRPSFRATPDFCHLPHGDCGDGIVNPYEYNKNNKNESSSGPNGTDSAAIFVENKYWAQRKRLFRRYDDGIQLDREGWFSVTPEIIANHIAERMCAHVSSENDKHEKEPSQKLVVLDAFTGVGGNAIAFALRPEVDRVVCVDLNPNRLQMAAHNCQVYEIPPEKLVFICADACDVMQRYQNGKLCQISSSDPATDQEGHSKAASTTVPNSKNQLDMAFGGIDLLPDRIDAIFLSPPWGGPNYENANGSDGFDLQCIQVNESCNGEDLLQYAKEALPN